MTAATLELPSPVRLEIDDEDVFHTFCDDAPRNIPRVVVACCGYLAKGDVELYEDVPAGQVECPLCPTIPVGKCACWNQREGQ